MPELLQRARDIDRLKTEAKTAVAKSIGDWKLGEAIESQAALDALVVEVYTECLPLLQEAAKSGAENGRAILKRIGSGAHDAGAVDFGALVDNELRTLQSEVRVITANWLDRLRLEVQKMRGNGIAEEQIAKHLESDWLAGTRGRVSSWLWSGLQRTFGNATTRLYQLSELAIRHGYEVTINAERA